MAMVIAAYRPKPGQQAALEVLARRHVPDLRAWGFATDRPALAMRATDGTIVEVFEWKEGAVERAHTDPRVLAMWEQYGKVCAYITLRDMAESAEMFPAFTALE